MRNICVVTLLFTVLVDADTIAITNSPPAHAGWEASRYVREEAARFSFMLDGTHILLR